jgi:hypothetical protein
MRYRTKPFVIDAVQYTGDADEVKSAFPDIDVDNEQNIFDSTSWHLVVWDYLQETWVQVNVGDYIIKGLKGEYYPCDPEVFETKYEVDE